MMQSGTVENLRQASIEYSLKPEDQLCFIRIPKTGSTTLISILDAQFHLSEICPVLMPSIPKTPQEELAKYRLFRAHCDYDIYQYLPKKPIYVTMLRNPLSRAISLYEFCKRGQKQSAFNELLRTAAKEGLQGFVCHPDPAIRIRTSNLQTRQIAAGLGSRHSDPFKPSELESKYSDADLLALAKQHIDECVCVGITERFDDSILLLSYIFGWYPIDDYQSLRVATKKTKKEELSQDIIDAVLEVNQLDLELYQYAKNRFEENFAQMLQGLSAFSQQEFTQLSPDQLTETSTRRSLSTALEQHYAQRVRAQERLKWRSLDFDFRQPISGKGWHRRNGPHSGLQGTNTLFRWTGPGTESTLDFPLATDAELTIRIRLTNYADPEILDSFALQVNQTPIPLRKILHRLRIVVFEGQISTTVLSESQGFTRLSLQVSHTIPVQEGNPLGTDDRIVGVAVHQIQVFPTTTNPRAEGFQQFLFPPNDPPWEATAEYLRNQLPSNEAIAAPMEFSELFPEQFCAYETRFDQHPQLNWLVVHKSYLTEIDETALRWAVERFRSVYANEVFVVFSSHRELPKLFCVSRHLRPFWRALRRRFGSIKHLFWENLFT